MEQDNEGDPAINAATDPAPVVEQAWFHRKSTFRYRAVAKLSRWSNGRLKSPSHLATEEFYRGKDAEENIKSRLAEGQRVETPGLWATEAYTPASAALLLRSLEKLTRSYRGLGDRDPAEWVRRQRRRPGSSYYLYLAKPGKGYVSSSFQMPLPSFAAAAKATIWSATASLTLITVAFELTEEARGLLNSILASEQPTRLKRSGGRGIAISSPDLERRRLVADARSGWVAEASRWFGSNFPGLFTTSGIEVPTCELSVLTGIHPFPERGAGRACRDDHQILDALRTSFADVFVPSGSTTPGIFYAPYPEHDERRSRHAIVAMTRAGYDSIDAVGGGDDVASHFRAFDEGFRSVVSEWHMTHILRLFDDRIASVRDQFAELIGGSKAGAALAKVRRDTADCADAATVAREIQQDVDDGSLSFHGTGFVLQARHGDDRSRTAAAALRETLQSSTRRLVVNLSELNTALHAQAALLSAHANLRIQAAIIVLATVSTIAGGIAAIEPIEKLLKHPVDLPAGHQQSTMPGGAEKATPPAG